MYRSITILVIVVAMGCSGTSTSPSSANQAYANQPAVSNAMDACKEYLDTPAELVRFLNLKPGMRVAELAAGASGGYITNLLATIVGKDGYVYAQCPPEWGIPARRTWGKHKAAELPQVKMVMSSFSDPLPKDANKLDMVVSVLSYHDIANMDNIKRSVLNAAVASALAQNGTYVIVDHHALRGAGTSVTRSLHRIEKQVVIDEVRAAGFELVEDVDWFRFANDDLSTTSVSLPQRRTDRFALKFKKSR